MSDAARFEDNASQFRSFSSADQMHAALAHEMVARLNDAISQSGHASMVVPGGTSPGPIFSLLAESDVPWSNVEIVPTDDRWIDPASDKSNEKLIRTRLLVGKAAAARLVPFKTAHAHAADAENALNDAVRAVRRPFDVTLLGMGVDGHIASLIPDARGLHEALDRNSPVLVRALHPHDLQAKGERISLTIRALLDSRWIAIVLRGNEKRDAYRWAESGKNTLEAPVRALMLQSEAPVSVFWAP